MDDRPILVRSYDVGFGDCIYVQIPDGEGTAFHMLIDCGTSSPAGILKPALDDALSLLPLEEGKRQLDLLVVTHPHADHIKGFNPGWLEGVHIRRIWLPVFMDAAHPQAEQAHALQEMAAACALAAVHYGAALSPAAQALMDRSAWSINNPGALRALREELARASGIHPAYPLYVARDLAPKLTRARRRGYALDRDQDTTRFRGFREEGTCLRVLAPEWNIDKYYLGRDLLPGTALAERQPPAAGSAPAAATALSSAAPDAVDLPRPANISERDFRVLRGRLATMAIAFSQEDDALKNNTSLVLLLEWRGRRLLFAGDAEWQGSGVELGRRNSTWDVMLHRPGVAGLLLRPLDFLKVAHHGSHNGTPFREGGEEKLRAMVTPGRTQVVVSTVPGKHGDEFPVPYPPLLVALGALASNARLYPNTPEEELRGVSQPQRTDLEPQAPGAAARYVEVKVPPCPA